VLINRKIWTEAEKNIVREMYPHNTSTEIITEFRKRGYTLDKNQLRNWADKEGLRKTQVGIDRAMARRGPDHHPALDAIDSLPTFNTFERIHADALTICCDIHVPFVDLGMVDNMLAISERFGSKDCLIIGDVFDAAMFSIFTTYVHSKAGDWTFQLEIADQVLRKLLKVFERIWITKGNHDQRLLKLAFGKIQMKHIFKWMTPEVEKQLIVTEYPFCRVYSGGQKWHCTHAGNYARNALLVPRQMAHKEECHIVNAGGHLTAQGFSESGRFLVGLGLMGDPKKFEYIHYKNTTHPKWNPSFLILKDGFPFLFPKQSTNWSWWLDHANQPRT